ncbi:MAG: DUF3098 domain-containing protein [Bacteroidales bacterium]|nr:DUF3098 domain-containing protein [Bacteroidales bacterium]
MNAKKPIREELPEDPKMPMKASGIRLLIVGVVVMALGYILMMGGGSDDPNVFNYAMFDFRRTVLAPIVILGGVAVEIVAIMKVFKK